MVVVGCCWGGFVVHVGGGGLLLGWARWSMVVVVVVGVEIRLLAMDVYGGGQSWL